MIIGVSPTMYVAAAAGLLMGIANGYANILLITWLQQKVAPEMIGRVMSLIMFSAVGLNPVSIPPSPIKLYSGIFPQADSCAAD